MAARLLTALLLTAAAARAEKVWVFEAGQSFVSVEAGRVSAFSSALGGSVRESDSGLLTATLHIPLASFVGEHGLPAIASPEVTFEGSVTPDQKHLHGKLTVNGVTKDVVAPITLVRGNGMLFGHATFTLHLADYGLPLPDARVDVDAGLRPERAPLASRG